MATFRKRTEKYSKFENTIPIIIAKATSAAYRTSQGLKSQRTRKTSNPPKMGRKKFAGRMFWTKSGTYFKTPPGSKNPSPGPEQTTRGRPTLKNQRAADILFMILY